MRFFLRVRKAHWNPMFGAQHFGDDTQHSPWHELQYIRHYHICAAIYNSKSFDSHSHTHTNIHTRQILLYECNIPRLMCARLILPKKSTTFFALNPKPGGKIRTRGQNPRSVRGGSWAPVSPPSVPIGARRLRGRRAFKISVWFFFRFWIFSDRRSHAPL